MSRYKVRVYSRVEKDLDEIYDYIAYEKLNPESASEQVERIKAAIFDLEENPESHQKRQVGRYSDGRYRQLLIDNYVVIFYVDNGSNTVFVVTVQYQGRDI